MNLKKLCEISEKPEIYEKGDAFMWDDEYISKKLLEIHLSQDTDLASRKKPAIEKTTGWILERLGKENADILDLGCGPGLYCEIFAGSGHRVTGVDISKRSIEYAREKALEKHLDISYINENYLNISFEEKFDLIVMIFCDIDVLVPVERDRLLDIVFKALKPGGMFIFDTMNGETTGIMKDGERNWEVSETGFWKDSPHMALSESFHYPENNVFLNQTIVFSEPDEYRTYRFWMNYYEFSGLRPVLEERGFSGVKKHENVLTSDDFYCGSAVTFYETVKPERII
ncbi:2-polyprenyl-3-methyl-5-hydroxy-6-metoxy-1,4-benzoquinol methylase [Methanomicrobium sp. W14]|uniref:class I SAM-dependent methyltransferase n=1 Tax=Methanomicrobium sp. W14 TaxID=2817839 RepID=UPI001AE8B421|nr:class I SAM-dependent methyltransferase [Methanomicrobium sp. W14]MBP2133567.1 2-polyprenyl-3-methyl-5-hydroxy-6-metoxy-1,4-benzoquinol methylase [Methanomicrobium sp. W14]